eukprot:g4048.t1
MGQRPGKAQVIPEAQPFVGLSKNVIEGLYVAFNTNSEGFAISRRQLVDICIVTKETLAATENVELEDKRRERAVKQLFKAMDTDKNKLIDALELQATLTMLSSMPMDQKCDHVFALFDFNRSGTLTSDEVAMAALSACTGLAKVTDKTIPDQALLELVSKEAFHRVGLAAGTGVGLEEDDFQGGGAIHIRDATRHLLINPHSFKYVTHFDNLVGGYFVLWNDLAPARATCPRKADEDRLGFTVPDTIADIEKLHTHESLGLLAAKRRRSTQKRRLENERRDWYKLVTEGGIRPSAYEEGRSPRVPRAPLVSARLDHVYGICKVEGSHSDVLYITASSFLFIAAKLGIVQDIARQRQRFFRKHKAEVVCAAICRQGNASLAATGDRDAPSPTIYVWDTTTLVAKHRIQGFHRTCISRLAFSIDGALLASIGGDDLHSLAVYDVPIHGDQQHVSSKLAFSSPTSAAAILDCTFVNDEHDLVTVGVRHFSSWMRCKASAEKGMGACSWVQRGGVFHRSIGHRSITCVSSSHALGKIVTGCAATAVGSSGDLCMWRTNDRQCFGSVRAHLGNVCSVHWGGNMDSLIVSGGEDGFIKVWNEFLELVGEFDVAALGSVTHSIRGVHVGVDAADGDGRGYEERARILVCTPGEIFEIDAKSGQNVHGDQPLVQAHCFGEICALSMKPAQPDEGSAGINPSIEVSGSGIPVSGEFCTGGADATLRVFDMNSRKMIKAARDP